MNGPEKGIVYLALFLFSVGVAVRVLPWGLPSIDSFQVEAGLQGFMSNLEYGASTSRSDDAKTVSANSNYNTDKVIELAGRDTSLIRVGDELPKKAKKTKKVKKTVKLPLRINEASAEDLCALNGVGPKLAEKIVAHRISKGPFKSAADLKKVPGIGAKKLEGILPGVIFD